jgi:hypothetical protein
VATIASRVVTASDSSGPIANPAPVRGTSRRSGPPSSPGHGLGQ